MTLGLQILIARKEKELSQKEVSRLTGITEATISAIENNKTDGKLSTIEKLLNLYGYELRLIRSTSNVQR